MNTKVINDITELGDRENELKKKLDSTNKQLFVRNSLFRKTTMFLRKMNSRRNAKTSRILLSSYRRKSRILKRRLDFSSARVGTSTPWSLPTNATFRDASSPLKYRIFASYWGIWMPNRESYIIFSHFYSDWGQLIYIIIVRFNYHLRSPSSPLSAC